MDEQMVAVGGRALQVSSVGSGPVTLVILSGSNILFPGLEYAPLADALREWYSVLIPSKFGYGFSDLTEAPRDVDTVVEEYRRVLAALKHPFPVVLAAHSMGFLEALHWASKYPEEISALVGLDPATPDAYQNMDLASVLHHLEHLGRPDWKRAILFQHRLDQRGKSPSPQHPSDTSGGTACLCPHAVSAFQRQRHSSSQRGMADVCEELSLCFFHHLFPSV